MTAADDLDRPGRAQAGARGVTGAVTSDSSTSWVRRPSGWRSWGTEAAELLRSARLERAIGVIYRPHTERQSHYFRARLADQFDVVIHIDETRALEPIERTARWEEGELPETLPARRVRRASAARGRIPGHCTVRTRPSAPSPMRRGFFRSHDAEKLV